MGGWRGRGAARRGVEGSGSGDEGVSKRGVKKINSVVSAIIINQEEGIINATDEQTTQYCGVSVSESFMVQNCVGTRVD